MYKYLAAGILMLIALENIAFSSDATITVKAGEEFTISRPENAGSTGYSWTEVVQDQAVVEFKTKQYQTPMRPMPGSKGTTEFIFEAKNPGTTTITLELRRPWEPKEAPAETYSIDVTVDAQ